MTESGACSAVVGHSERANHDSGGSHEPIVGVTAASIVSEEDRKVGEVSSSTITRT